MSYLSLCYLLLVWRRRLRKVVQSQNFWAQPPFPTFAPSLVNLLYGTSRSLLAILKVSVDSATEALGHCFVHEKCVVLPPLHLFLLTASHSRSSTSSLSCFYHVSIIFNSAFVNSSLSPNRVINFIHYFTIWSFILSSRVSLLWARYDTDDRVFSYQINLESLNVRQSC